MVTVMSLTFSQLLAVRVHELGTAARPSRGLFFQRAQAKSAIPERVLATANPGRSLVFAS